MNQPDFYEPALFGFRELFYGATNNRDDKSNQHRRFGFHDGVSILLTGGPGSGKTTFAFACARDLLFRYRKEGVLLNSAAPEINSVYYLGLEVNDDRLQRMYHEMGWLDENDQLFHSNGHLSEFYPAPREDRPPLTPEETLNDILRRIREKHRQKAPRGKIIVIVDSLNALLRDCADRGEARRQTHEFLVRLGSILGNVEGTDESRLALAFLVSEDVASRTEEIPVSEYVTDFVFRFDTQKTGGNRKLRTFEVIKSQGANMRIGRHTWAIVSGRDVKQVFTQPEVIARVQWASQQGWPAEKCTREQELNEKECHRWLSDKLNKNSPNTDSKAPLWGTAVIFAKEGMRPIGLASDQGEIGYQLRLMRQTTKRIEDLQIQGNNHKKNLFSGIPGLDAMLALKEDYWAKAALYYPKKESRSIRGIIPGTTTLLMGPAGTGKTTMSLQFLQGGAISRLEENPTDRSRARNNLHVLYVNFENPFSHIVSLYPGRQNDLRTAALEDNGFILDRNVSKEETAEADGVTFHLHTLHRRRGNLDANILLAEIRYLMAIYPISRIAIDGLASLLATTEHLDARALSETLVTSIQSVRSLNSLENSDLAIFLTYESLPEGDSETPLHLSGIADNLVVLRQISIGNERRTCIEVVKARHLKHDRVVREVRVENTSRAPEPFEVPLAIRPGFENYAGILEDNIRPVEVYLQMFAENHAEENMNQWLRSYLERNFDYKVRDFRFSRHAISRTLEDLKSDASRIPTPDIRILSVDEWWIRDHPMDDHPLLWLVPFEPQVPDESSKIDPIQTGIATTLSDFWAPEIEKASLLSYISNKADDAKADNFPADAKIESDSAERPDKLETRLMALPCYMDFGLFCINLKFTQFDDLPEASKIRKLSGKMLRKHQRDLWDIFLKKLPRVWAYPSRYSLEIWSNTKLDELPNEGRLKVVIGYTGDEISIRFFDDDGKKVMFDSRILEAEKKNLDELKRTLAGCNSNVNKLSQRKKQKIIELATAVTGHNLSRSKWYSREENLDSANRKNGKQWKSICDALDKNRSASKGKNVPRWLFAFDMEIPEVAFSAFLEMAWSFGAREDFIVQDAVKAAGSSKLSDEEVDAMAVTASIRFLMFLVYEDLMPASPKMSDARNALFSRLYYSNFVDLTSGSQQPKASESKKIQDDPFGDEGRRKQQKREHPVAEPLMMLPFFPVGFTSERDRFQCFSEAFDDLAFRFIRLVRRALSAILAHACPGSLSEEQRAEYLKNGHDSLPLIVEHTKVRELLSIIADAEDAREKVNKLGIDSTDDRMRIRKVQLLRDLGEKLEKHCWEAHDEKWFQPRVGSSSRTVPDLISNLRFQLHGSLFSEAYISGKLEERKLVVRERKRKLLMEGTGIASFDLRDALEILRWHELRLRMLSLEIQGMCLSRDSLDLATPQLDSTRNGDRVSKKSNLEVTGLTGYPCTGSWMVGLFRTTQSPGLSSKYMEEICSLESSHKRAQLGAGLPARKDFYEFYGDDPATYAEYLSWNELYRFLGCRARRRERALCSYVPVSSVTEIVHEELRTCFAFAEVQRHRGESKSEQIPKMIAKARNAVRSILHQAALLMHRGADAEHCADCPHPDKCKEVIQKEKGANSIL